MELTAIVCLVAIVQQMLNKNKKHRVGSTGCVYDWMRITGLDGTVPTVLPECYLCLIHAVCLGTVLHSLSGVAIT